MSCFWKNIELERDLNVKLRGMYKEYYEPLSKWLGYLQRLLVDFKMMKHSVLNKKREFFSYKSRDLVYIISAFTIQLRTYLANDQ